MLQSNQVKHKSAKRQSTKSSLLLAAAILGTTTLLTACGGNEHEEVHAVDKVDEASEMARANAPEAEVLDLEVTESEATTDMTTSEGATDDMASETDVESDEMPEADESATIDPEASEATESEVDKEAEPEVTALAADAGKKRYETTCKACHETGLLNAPKFGDKEAWASRIEKGIDTLHKHSAEGFKQMPAQANDDVSKEEVYAAVDYMVAQSS